MAGLSDDEVLQKTGFDSNFNTKLAPEEETSFKAWKEKFAPKDSGSDYDLRGAFKAGLTPDQQTGHWPDTFKKPNHPTFSDQSQYAEFGKPGRWEGDKFIAPAKSGLTDDEVMAKTKPSKRTPAKMAAEDPTIGMSSFQRGVAGYGKAGADLVRGTGHLIRDVAELVPGGERAANAVGLPTSEDIAAAKTRDEPLMRTLAGQIGNVTGNIAAAVPTAFIPGANTVAGAGLIGAGYGALQPAAGWLERGQNVIESAGMSAGITGAVRALPAAYRALVSPFREKGQEDIALSTLMRFAKDPNAVRTAAPSELIPGSKASLAEVTGDPGIAQLQRAAQAKSPEVATLFSDAHTARLQARKDALLSISGDYDDRAFFEAARDQTARRLYGNAFKAPIDPKAAQAVQPAVEELLARPSIVDAKAQALRLAKEEGDVLGAADLEGGSIKGLHYMKRAVDDQIGAAKRAGDNNLARLLMGTKDKLVGVMQKLSPKYAQAMAEYQDASRPINTMDVGRYLYDKLIPAASDVGAERQTPQKFLAALKEGDKMAAKATGFKGAKLADILSTDQLNTVISLAKDVGREIGAVERAKVPGSPTAQYLSGANLLRQVMGPLGLPESWVEKTIGETLASWGSKFPFNVAEGKIQSKLGEMLVDPAAAKAVADRQASSFSAKLPVSELMRRTLPPAAIGVSSSYGAQQ